MNTASGVVLFLDADDGSKHALLHLKMFLIKRELKDLQREQEFLTKSSQFKVSVPVGWDINHKEVCFLRSVKHKTTRSFAGAAGAGNPISCMC